MSLDRQRILEAMAAIGTANPGDPRVFLAPRSLKRILNPSTVVVLGARGSGKSELAAFLSQRPGDFSALEVHGIDRRIYFDAFSQKTTQQPDATTLDEWVISKNEEEIRFFWLKWLLLRLLDGIGSSPPEPIDLERQNLAVRDPGALFQDAQSKDITHKLDVFDREVSRWNGTTDWCVAVYDDLDTVGAFDFELRRRFIRALLVLWTTLSTRYKNLRAKIFLPSDLFDLRLFDTPDASKLMARAERLEWDVPSLYRLVLRHLGAQGEDVRDWLGTFGLRFQESGESGWIPEEPSEESLKRWLTETLRAVVAVNGTRSAVQQWIPNRLRDGKDQVAPRSMLGFFRESARIALSRAPGASRGRLLAVEDAVDALSRVGEFRVGEIREVYPWVDRMEALRGRVLPLSREQVEVLLERDPPRRVRETAAREGHLVTADLVRLGLLRELEGGDRIDVPDLFVSTFGILRGEGAPPANEASPPSRSDIPA
jgi:hypothetical protein